MASQAALFSRHAVDGSASNFFTNNGNTNNATVNALVGYHGNSFWTGTTGQALSLTYQFDGLNQLNEELQAMMENVMAKVEAIADVRFYDGSRIASLPSKHGVDLGFELSDSTRFSGQFNTGDYWLQDNLFAETHIKLAAPYISFDTSHITGSFEGSWTYLVALHEMGHALGLKHTHEGGATLDEALDSTQNTVMSYQFDKQLYGSSGEWVHAYDYGALDAEALTHLYGEAHGNNQTIRLGNGETELAGASGRDLLVGNAQDNVIFGGGRLASPNDAADTLEGGAGNDQLFGNGGDDSLLGGTGDDFLHGGFGHDELFGGTGNDTLTGSHGEDVFYFAATSGHDVITDFTIGEDVLILDRNFLSQDASASDAVADWLRPSGDGLTLQFTVDTSLHLHGLSNIETTSIVFAEFHLA